MRASRLILRRRSPRTGAIRQCRRLATRGDAPGGDLPRMALGAAVDDHERAGGRPRLDPAELRPQRGDRVRGQPPDQPDVLRRVRHRVPGGHQRRPGVHRGRHRVRLQRDRHQRDGVSGGHQRQPPARHDRRVVVAHQRVPAHGHVARVHHRPAVGRHEPQPRAHARRAAPHRHGEHRQRAEPPVGRHLGGGAVLQPPRRRRSRR